MHLIEGIWQTKFDYEKSIKCLEKSMEIFENLVSSPPYFRAACLLEIANSHIRMQESDMASAFLEVVLDLLKEQFPEDHAIMTKYHNYNIEIASLEDKDEMMMEISLKIVDLARKANPPHNGK